MPLPERRLKIVEVLNPKVQIESRPNVGDIVWVCLSVSCCAMISVTAVLSFGRRVCNFAIQTSSQDSLRVQVLVLGVGFKLWVLKHPKKASFRICIRDSLSETRGYPKPETLAWPARREPT